MEAENELMLETTAYLQLLDLEDRRAELVPDEPSLSDLEITYDLIEADIRATLQSIRDRRIARAVHNAGRAADLTLINNIAEVELRDQEERERSFRLSRRSPPSVGSSSSSSSGSSNLLSITDSESSDPGSPNSSVFDLPSGLSSTDADKIVYVPQILRLPAGRFVY
ncbi:unnamed protein product [Rhizoctonia solani]|uniref:Uncharacterized protein n=1 Tax=Rhizoctonia solani TaxID=456999 RepID=A0A8H3CEF8_9AGAM|nr:unnamed protein product [Rhizoctonia solani]